MIDPPMDLNETMEKWILTTPSALLMVILSAVCTYAAILVYTRVVGLRSLSKMSAADFAMTVAVGSLFASTIATSSPPLLLGLVAIASLYFGQWLIAKLRHLSPAFASGVDNQPMMLMRDGKFLDHNLRRANVTHGDVYGKLRECNALELSKVHAVILETTGDVSVLHGDPSIKIAEELLKDVRQ